MMNWIVIAAAAACCLALALAVKRRVGSREHRRAESDNLALVRRRRELRDELQRLVPDVDEAARLLQSSAKRLGISGSAPEALQAAIEEASRRAEQGGKAQSIAK